MVGVGGSGVTIGEGVGDTTVAAGGAVVAVGGSDVSVAGTGVAVGGRDVLVDAIVGGAVVGLGVPQAPARIKTAIMAMAL